MTPHDRHRAACSAGHRRPRARLGPWAERGPRRLGPRATPELHGAVRSGTACCGLNRDHGPCMGRGSYASTHAHLGTAGRETLWGSRAASGPEELRDSEQSHRCRRDTVAFRFQYLVPQVTVSDDSTINSELALLHSELHVAIRILPFALCPRVLKADCEETRQSSYNPNRV